MKHSLIFSLAAGIFCLGSGAWGADLPTGYLVWTKGDGSDPASRKIYRMTLPEKTDIRALTSGLPAEDIEGQISPDGKWVAYAKAKLPASNYHQTKGWKLYLVSIHGIGDGREEIKIDDNGYWPSWGQDGELYYSQVDEEGDSEHTRIMRVSLDERGATLQKNEIFSTREHFADQISVINECFMAPDGSWFAGRTRGDESVSGVGAFTMNPPSFVLLAKAGSVGCMPQVAPSGTWGLIAGRDHGIRWGEAPSVADRKQDQQLIFPFDDQDLCYHPGIASDEQWALSAHSTDNDHDAGPYDLYIYKLNDKTATAPIALVEGCFNGWPHIWVGEPSDPPPPNPHVDSFLPDSYTIVAGQDLVLHWQTSFADQVNLDQDPVDPDGSLSLSPAQSQTYTLTAASSEVSQTHSASLAITVVDSEQAVIIEDFAIAPTQMVTGETAVLSWQVMYPHTLGLNDEPVPPAGSLEVSPINATDREKDFEYTLTATGHSGPVVQTLTLTVSPLKQGLDDRGGCMCSSTGPNGWWLTGLALLFWVRRRQGHVSAP